MRNAVKATLRSTFKRRRQSRTGRQGQTLVEYALILAIVSVVAVGVIYNLGQKVGAVYSTITSVVASAQSSH